MLVADAGAPVAVADDIGMDIDIDIVAWSILVELDPISILLRAAIA